MFRPCSSALVSWRANIGSHKLKGQKKCGLLAAREWPLNQALKLARFIKPEVGVFYFFLKPWGVRYFKFQLSGSLICSRTNIKLKQKGPEIRIHFPAELTQDSPSLVRLICNDIFLYFHCLDIWRKIIQSGYWGSQIGFTGISPWIFCGKGYTLFLGFQLESQHYRSYTFGPTPLYIGSPSFYGTSVYKMLCKTLCSL